jgi:GTP-binding protein Era
MASDNRCGYLAITGRPNVGKSTLLNRAIGQKLAITSHKPQTTRHRILGIKTLPRGQIVYVDTPGIHKRLDNAMNRYLNRTAKGVLSDVNAILFVVEALRWTEEDAAVLESVVRARVPVILAINKVDQLHRKDDLLPFMAEMSARYDFQTIVPVSATKGTQLEQLEKAVLDALPHGENLFPDEQITDRPERFFAAELVREQLTRRYGKELPYALSVEIEAFEAKGNLYRISAIIWVERPGQKAIIIGKDGASLKEAGREARIQMERLFQCKVFLKLWVKVKKSWSNDEAALLRLGYGE